MSDVQQRDEEKRPKPLRLALSDVLFLVGAIWVGINIGAGLPLGTMAVLALGASLIYRRRGK